jgi:hypothetical protein
MGLEERVPKSGRWKECIDTSASLGHYSHYKKVNSDILSPLTP